jgi:hypothetical protein
LFPFFRGAAKWLICQKELKNEHDTNKEEERRSTKNKERKTKHGASGISSLFSVETHTIVLSFSSKGLEPIRPIITYSYRGK